MKFSVILIVFFSLVIKLKAQTVFMHKGKITFEKKVNMLREREGWDLPDDAKDNLKKYRTSNWNLFFDDDQSLFKAEPKKEEAGSSDFIFFGSGGSTNEMYTNYQQNKRVFCKNIMNDEFIFKDTIPKLDWKILQDVRMIAGYECRKALTRINDTVYVVAFYTDQILLKGGPEGFGGLPGMILGLAIPRYNTTWFATKVEFTIPKIEDLTPPLKGKKTESEKDYKAVVELFTRYDDNKKKEKPEDTRKRLYGLTL